MSTAITKQTSKTELDERINAATESIQSLALSVEDEEFQATLLQLAQLAHPTIEGVEDGGNRGIARLFLCQNITASELKPDDCKPGQFFNSLGETVGSEVNIIPIKQHSIRRKWNEEGEGVECSSLDGKTGSRYGDCKECPWGRYEPGVAPKCSLGQSYYCVTEDLTQLYRIDFIKTSAAAGRNIKRLALPPSLWSRVFKLSSEQKKESQRNYYVMKTSPTGARTSEQAMTVCKALHELFDAQYQRALLGQAEYSQRLKSGEADGKIVTTTGEEVKVSDSDDDVVDFSDSM